MQIPPKPLFFALLLLSGCGGGGGGGGGAPSQAEVGSQEAGQEPAVTWYSAAKPLLDRYCVACHSDGGLAPFPLETYQQAYGKRSALVYVLEAGTMPPAGYADLSVRDSDLLLEWLDSGAPKGDPSQLPLQDTADQFTYHADARPIIDKHCVGCHVDGGIAPFPLDGYDKVKPVAAAAAFAVENGSMPPWPPTEGYTRLEHPRLLSPDEEYVLLSWLRGDLAEGNPADYAPPQVEVEANPPDFNLELPMRQAYTPTLRPDDHRCFAIEWPLDEFAYVTDVDVLPDQVSEVHHVIVSIAEPEDAALYYAAEGEDGRPGWYCLGAGGVSGAPLPRQIGGWVPGAGREPAPKGTGIGVRPGSVMVVQMHYNTLVAEPTPDRSTVLVATADEVARPSSGFLITDPAWLQPGGMPIQAGDANARHEMTFPAWALARIFGAQAGVGMTDPWVMHNGFIHMHNLGSSGRITLLRQDGTEQVLLDIRDWDFNWQGTYRFERELLINPLDNIRLECTWDNSQQNQPFVGGVQQPSQYVEWGDGTNDEMCLMSVLMTRPLANYDYGYQASLHIESPAYRQQFAPGDLLPLRLVLNNFALQDPGEHGHSDADGHSGDDHGPAYSGHYHVYLDADDDEADHLTAWDSSYYFQLPDDIAPGLHRLRVSLRGHDHRALGIEDTVEFEVVESRAAERLTLIDVDAWVEQSAGADSLAAHRPSDVDCPANSWYEEDGALEVETGYCNYLSLVQPGKTAVRAGDALHLVLWHGNLAFEEPATAHVAISIAGELVWEQEVEIPARAEIFDVRIPIDFDAPAGAEVEYHLHNHGYNTWTLLQLSVERP
jgi:mono/diheme cytochrome c family protein